MKIPEIMSKENAVLRDHDLRQVNLVFKNLTYSEFHQIRNNALDFEYRDLINLIGICQQMMESEKVQDWIDFFDLLDLKNDVHKEFYLKGYLMNQMSDILRKRKFSLKELDLIANQPVLSNHVFESFVDYTTLEKDGYYSRIIKEFNPVNLEQESFKKSLILFEYYLNGNKKEVGKWSEALSRYPTDVNYFPIINSRIWAARFLRQMHETGQVQDDLVQEWIREWLHSEESKLLLSSLETLPILVVHNKNHELKKMVLDLVEGYMKKALAVNPAEWCFNHGIFTACKIAYYKQINDMEMVRRLRREMASVSYLSSYSAYISSISAMEIGHLS